MLHQLESQREKTSVLCSLLFNQVTHELPFLLADPSSPCAVLWDWSNLTWFPKGSVAYSLRSICFVSKTLLKWTGTTERALNELLLCKRVTWHIIFMFILTSTFRNCFQISAANAIYNRLIWLKFTGKSFEATGFAKPTINGVTVLLLREDWNFIVVTIVLLVLFSWTFCLYSSITFFLCSYFPASKQLSWAFI